MKAKFMKWTSFSLLLLVTSVFMLSCEPAAEELVPEINLSKNEITITRLGLNDEGNITTVDVLSNVYWAASIEQDDEWLSMTPMAGVEDVIIEITAKANEEDDSRQATITLETLDGTQAKILVTQSGANEIIYYLYEDMGTTPVNDVDVNFYDEWTKRGIGSLLTRYVGLNASAVDSNNPSDYENASGGNNILFPEKGSAVIWGQVNTRSQEYFTISMGLYAPTAFDETDVELYISKDEDTWIPLEFTRSTAQGWEVLNSKFKVADIPYMYFKLVSNKEGVRMDDIHLLVDPTESGEEVIFQTVIDDGQPAGYVYFEEDFSWITVETFGGTAANFPTNELGFTNANITAEQQDTIEAYGWTQELGATYMRPGIMKLGKTSVGGDIISPALSKIGTYASVNVELSFDVAMYESAGGTRVDLDGIKIEIRNGGTIESQALTSHFALTNTWVSDKTEQTEEAEFNRMTFTIFGATARTQIRIMSGIENSEQVRQGESNRFFLDNIKVIKLAD